MEKEIKDLSINNLNINLSIFLFALAVIHGVSFHVMDVTNAINLPDCNSYLGIANLDLDQYVVRKYRVLVPFMAGGLNYLFGGVFHKLAPWSFNGDFGLALSFLIVNNLIMAYAGLLLFKLVMAYTQNYFASLVGLVTMLTCRWTGFVAGLPLVDSLYLLVLVMMLVGLKTNDMRYVIAAIFIGPWAKEAFLFMAPIIFFYSAMPKSKLFVYFLLSGVIVFAGRFLIDAFSHGSMSTSLAEDFDHFNNCVTSLGRLFSFHGVYEVFSVVGVWSVLLLVLVKNKGWRWFKCWGGIEGWFFASVLFQAILSTELARMFYLSTPLLAVAWAIVINEGFINRQPLRV